MTGEPRASRAVAAVIRTVRRGIGVPRAAAILVLRGYQRGISPWLPAACRFYPTCSEYAVQAIGRFGLLRGGWMGLCRLGRCHPFHAGGIDLVPPATPQPLQPHSRPKTELEAGRQRASTLVQWH